MSNRNKSPHSKAPPNQPSFNRTHVVGGVLFFLFVVGAVADVFGAWDGIKGVAKSIIYPSPAATSRSGDVSPDTPTVMPMRTLPVTSPPAHQNKTVLNNCITPGKWLPYAEGEASVGGTPSPITPVPQTKCWYLYDWGISLDNGQLQFDSRKLDDGLYGISTEISPNTRIEFDLKLLDVGWNDHFDIAIISGESVRPYDRGVFVDFWGGDITQVLLILHRLENSRDENIWTNLKFTEESFRVRLQVENARLSLFINGEPFTRFPADVVYTNPRLWIGYRLSPLVGDTKIIISNLSIEID